MVPRVMASLSLVASIAVAALLGASPVLAQDVPVRWDVKAGFSQPVGSTSDIFQGGGYSFGTGLTLTPHRGSPFSFRFDLDYTQHNATTQLLSTGADQTGAYVYGGTGSFTSLTANGVYRVPLGRGVRAYGIAGIGVYYAQVDFDLGGYYGGFCNPFWGCYAYGPGYASSSTTKFGWNAGLGVEFPLYYGQAWFIEARFNRIETQQAIEYVPITVGFRF